MPVEAMSEQMEPGPELDAKLAEAMGRIIWPKHRSYKSYGGGPPMVIDGPDKERYPDAELHCEYGDVPKWSTDIALAISAAEECRKAGRIDDWSVGAARTNREGGVFYDALVYAPHPARSGATKTRGTSPAHALVLALLAALTGEK